MLTPLSRLLSFFALFLSPSWARGETNKQTNTPTRQVARLEDVCSRQVKYILEMEAYANSVEDANLKLSKQVGRSQRTIDRSLSLDSPARNERSSA